MIRICLPLLFDQTADSWVLPARAIFTYHSLQISTNCLGEMMFSWDFHRCFSSKKPADMALVFQNPPNTLWGSVWKDPLKAEP